MIDIANDKTKATIKKILAVLKFAVLLFLVVGLPLIIYFQFPDVISYLSSREKADALLHQYWVRSVLIYIAVQVVQIIIAVIPGQPIQLAAGYAWNLGVAYGLSIFSIAIGTVITYYLGRVLGKDMILLIFGEEKTAKFIGLLNSRKGYLAIIILYLFPGIPKDVFSYAAGISQMKMRPFVLLSLIARSPALICSLLVGRMFHNESYTGIIIIAAVVLAVAILGIIFRKKVYDIIDKIYVKFNPSAEPEADGDNDKKGENDKGD